MIFVANWKMRLGVGESENLARDILRGLRITLRRAQDDKIVICPSYTALDRVADVLRGTRVALGAQDVFWTSRGAFTGEVSALELKELGCSYAIVGHSERRALGESDADVGRKVKAALDAKLTPILCVGEPLAVRRAGRQAAFVTRQLKTALRGLRRPRVIVAYEPVWAIGSGKPDDPREASRMSEVIRRVAGNVPVLYGGSVSSKNSRDFLSVPGIHGALIGGASLRSSEFLAIVRTA